MECKNNSFIKKAENKEWEFKYVPIIFGKYFIFRNSVTKKIYTF